MTFGVVASSHAPFASAWTDLNLLNSWAQDSDPDYETPGYIEPDAVYLRGLIADGTTTAATVVADNLPAPSGQILFPSARAGSPYAFGMMDVNASGELLTRSVSATGTYLPVHPYLPNTVSQTAPTLLNSWVDFGGAYEGAGYYKDASGTVYLQGLIKSGATSSGTTLFTLPTGHRPSGTLRFFVPNSNSTGSVDIDASGNVKIISGGNTYLSLSGIRFSTASQTAPTLLNSWVNYGGAFTGAGYYKDANGVVHLQGLIKSGTTTQGTTLFTLPTGYRPASSALSTIWISTGIGYIYVTSSGDVKVGQASSSATSLHSFSFPVAT